MSAASCPSVQRPNDSPRSQFRSMSMVASASKAGLGLSGSTVPCLRAIAPTRGCHSSRRRRKFKTVIDPPKQSADDRPEGGKCLKNVRHTACSIGGCERPEYLRQGAVSCWGAGSPAKQGHRHHGDALFSALTPFLTTPFASDCRSFRILQRQPQFLRQRLRCRLRVLPGALGFEPQIADPAAPRRDDAADGAEVGPIGVLLIQPPNDVRRDADEGAERGGALDAVLPAVPGRAEHLRDLLEVVDVELPRLLAELLALPARARRPPPRTAS